MEDKKLAELKRSEKVQQKLELALKKAMEFTASIHRLIEASIEVGDDEMLNFANELLDLAFDIGSKLDKKVNRPDLVPVHELWMDLIPEDKEGLESLPIWAKK